MEFYFSKGRLLEALKSVYPFFPELFKIDQRAYPLKNCFI